MPYRLAGLIFLVLLILDIASKELIVRSSLFFVFNTDTAFKPAVFLLLLVFCVVAAYWRQPLAILGATALAAGAVGNALYAGAVPDFLLIPSWVPGSETGQIFPAPNSAANLADCFIWVGAVLYVIGLLKGRFRPDCGAKVG